MLCRQAFVVTQDRHKMSDFKYRPGMSWEDPIYTDINEADTTSAYGLTRTYRSMRRHGIGEELEWHDNIYSPRKTSRMSNLVPTRSCVAVTRSSILHISHSVISRYPRQRLIPPSLLLPLRISRHIHTHRPSNITLTPPVEPLIRSQLQPDLIWLSMTRGRVSIIREYFAL